MYRKTMEGLSYIGLQLLYVHGLCNPGILIMLVPANSVVLSVELRQVMWVWYQKTKLHESCQNAWNSRVKGRYTSSIQLGLTCVSYFNCGYEIYSGQRTPGTTAFGVAAYHRLLALQIVYVAMRGHVGIYGNLYFKSKFASEENDQQLYGTCVALIRAYESMKVGRKKMYVKKLPH